MTNTTLTRTSEEATNSHVAALTTAIVQTRGEMSQTIEKLHGRLNPRVFKEAALEQFRDARDAVKIELKADVEDAKDAVRAGLTEAKESLKAELTETKDQLATGLKEGVSNAKIAIREATIGKVETMVHNTQETVKTASRSLMGAVKENPIPAAMIGMGLVWLIASSRSKAPSNGASTYGRTAPAVGEFGGSYEGPTGDFAMGDSYKGARGGGATVDGAMGAIGDAAGSIKDKAWSLAHEAGDMTKGAANAVSGAAHAAADKMSHLATGAAAQGRRLGHKAEDSYMGNPLAIGAVVLATGVAVGLAIPSSKLEDKLMGTARDGVLGKAGAMADEALDGLDETAKKITDTSEEVLNGKALDDEAGDGVEGGDYEDRPTGRHTSQPQALPQVLPPPQKKPFSFADGR